MKRLLSYIGTVLGVLAFMSSCSEDCADMSADEANLELKIAMVSTGPSYYSKAPGSETIQPDKTEPGNAYENEIISKEYLRLFIFKDAKKSANQTYIGEITDFTISESTSEYKILSGKLPPETFGQKIRLILMANYNNRSISFKVPGPGKTFDSWKQDQTFSYGKTPWSSDDANSGRYIPMTGSCSLTVDPDLPYNYGSIDLVRAISKIRIKVADGCPFILSHIKVGNAIDKSYMLNLGNPYTIDLSENQTSNGLSDILNFPGVNLNPGEVFEFYMPEQAVYTGADRRKSPFITLFFKRNPDGSPIVAEGENVHFKYYPSNDFYPVQRNYIYEFVVYKKETDKLVDVSASVMPWVIHTINTDYE